MKGKPTHCIECGKPIEQPRAGRRLYCDDLCRKRHKYSGTCADCGGRTSGLASGRARGVPERCSKCQFARNADRNAEILAAWNEGMELPELAAKFGLTQPQAKSVVVVARKNGMEVRKHRQGGTAEAHAARRAKITKWAREGVTNSEIAERLNAERAPNEPPTNTTAIGTAVCDLRARGVDIPARRHSIASDEEIIRRWAEGETLDEIAAALGYASGGSVSNRITRLRAKGHDVPHRRAGVRREARSAA